MFQQFSNEEMRRILRPTEQEIPDGDYTDKRWDAALRLAAMIQDDFDGTLGAYIEEANTVLPRRGKQSLEDRELWY